MSKPSGKKITLKDIARETGLSHPAVSQALTGSLRGTVKVSETTRERVRRAAARMGYRPNRAARALRSGRSGLIGVIHCHGADPIATRRLLGALEAIHATPLRPFVHLVDLRFEHTLREAADTLLGAGVEAVLALMIPAGLIDKEFRQLQEARIPVAAIGGYAPPGSLRFQDDRRDAFQQLAAHVLDLGARSIAFVGGIDERGRPEELSAKLLEAIRQAVEEHQPIGHHPARCQLEIIGSAPQAIEDAILRNPDICNFCVPGYIAMQDLIRRGNLPDAILCQVDAFALGAMRACTENGIRLPQQIALAGFGNEAAASAGAVPLTTADHPIQELSRLAVTHLLGQIRAPHPPATRDRTVLHPCRLIPRISTLGTTRQRRQQPC